MLGNGKISLNNVLKILKDPLKLLSIGMVVGLAIIPVMGSVVWGMYGALTRIGSHELRLLELSGTVSHLNEVLTMSARMAAVTGEKEWEKRYKDIEPHLDNAINEIAMLARAEYESNYAAQTKLAYAKLIEMESVAFSLVRVGRDKEASAILFSNDYNQYKELYSQSIRNMSAAVKSRIHAELNVFRNRISGTGLLGLMSLALSAFAWIGVTYVVKTHLNYRKRAENALAHEKELLLVTLRSIGEGVIATDVFSRITLINPVAQELTGWTEERALGRPIEEVFCIMDEKTRVRAENPVEKVLKTGAVCGLANHTILVTPTGKEMNIADCGAPILNPKREMVGVVLVFRDVTEEKHMLREAAKAEKLESVGLLAGGIAHDFNNILAAIMGNISLAKMHVKPHDSAFMRIAEAEKGISRAKDLTQQLLTFARGGAPVRKPASMNQLLVEWCRFALRGSQTSCEFRIQEDLWDADVDEGQVSQVIHNLVVNADQAMPDGGRIYISAKNFVSNGGGPAIVSGKYILISIEDEGVGVQAEHLQKIFDPYFTTKEAGSGLGLATSHAIVKKHGGHITVRSQVKKGTTFDVFLPAAGPGIPAKTEAPIVTRLGQGRVLLMDDEQMVRDIAQEMLTILGYRVSLTEDGSEAIDLYRQAKQSGEPFDVVIMDLTVPGRLGGKEALMLLREFDPDIKAIVSSGYSNDPIMGNFEKYGFCGVLSKPYNTKEMSEVLFEVMNGNSAVIDLTYRKATANLD